MTSTRFERRGESWDPGRAETDLMTAYSMNGKIRPALLDRYPCDMDFPDVALIHSCRCGCRFQVRRDRDTHATHCPAA